MPFRRLRFVVLLLAVLTLGMETAHVLELLGLASLLWSVLAHERAEVLP